MNDAVQTYRAFAAWRKRQDFATPEVASRARLVEADLRLLTTDAGRIAAIRESAAQNVAEFRAMLVTQAS